MPTSETLLIFTAAPLLMNIFPGPVPIQEYVSGSILVGPGLYVAQTERAN
jgi:hypothetical protein